MTSSAARPLEARPLPGIPELKPGSDLSGLIADAAAEAAVAVASGDVIVVAQKVISKVEGRLRALDAVRPGKRARELAADLDKDPRFVQLVLDESEEVIRAQRGVLITRTRQGHICANAGIDGSNVPGDMVSLLPEDPDASARRLRSGLRERLGQAPAVVISDSFGRPWRIGQVEVAIGCAGLQPLDDRRGLTDAFGQVLSATLLAVADEAAAAAGLVRFKEGREGVVIVRGLERYITKTDGPGARALLRPKMSDLFT